MGHPPVIASVMTVVLLLSCSTGDIAGNSSETTNGLTVVARGGSIDGTAPPFSSLYLFEEKYDPFSGKHFDSVKTDTTGVFSFQVPEAGYNLFCNAENGKRAQVHIIMNADPESGDTGKDHNIFRDTIHDTLKIPGNVAGYIPAWAKKNLLMSYLYLEGTPFFAFVDSVTGYYRIEDIPEGRYIIRLYTAVPYHIPDTLSYESAKVISVKSDSTLSLKWEL